MPRKNSNMQEVSIIVPVYNEINAIEETIKQLHLILNNQNILYELIVVNDGSTDGTTDKLKQINSDFKYLEQFPNKGYGSAVKKGIRKSKYSNILITDADSTYPIEEIPELLAHLKDNDMVVGQRSFKNLPGRTKSAKWLINRLANYQI